VACPQRERWLLVGTLEDKTTMGAPSDFSKPTRGLAGSDVWFLLSLAFIFFSLIVTIAVMRH
jgi:hypothetical protein